MLLRGHLVLEILLTMPLIMQKFNSHLLLESQTLFLDWVHQFTQISRLLHKKLIQILLNTELDVLLLLKLLKFLDKMKPVNYCPI